MVIYKLYFNKSSLEKSVHFTFGYILPRRVIKQMASFLSDCFPNLAVCGCAVSACPPGHIPQSHTTPTLRSASDLVAASSMHAGVSVLLHHSGSLGKGSPRSS